MESAPFDRVSEAVVMPRTRHCVGAAGTHSAQRAECNLCEEPRIARRGLLKHRFTGAPSRRSLGHWAQGPHSEASSLLDAPSEGDGCRCDAASGDALLKQPACWLRPPAGRRPAVTAVTAGLLRGACRLAAGGDY